MFWLTVKTALSPGQKDESCCCLQETIIIYFAGYDGFSAKPFRGGDFPKQYLDKKITEEEANFKIKKYHAENKFFSTNIKARSGGKTCYIVLEVTCIRFNTHGETFLMIT